MVFNPDVRLDGKTTFLSSSRERMRGFWKRKSLFVEKKRKKKCFDEEARMDRVLVPIPHFTHVVNPLILRHPKP